MAEKSVMYYDADILMNSAISQKGCFLRNWQLDLQIFFCIKFPPGLTHLTGNLSVAIKYPTPSRALALTSLGGHQ